MFDWLTRGRAVPNRGRGSRSTHPASTRLRKTLPQVEALEGRRLMSASRGEVSSHAVAVVDQTYRVLVGRAPSTGEARRLLRIQEVAGPNALVPAIVASRPFYNRTAGGDAARYVELAAATLDVFPGPAQVEHLTRAVIAEDADPRVLDQVVLRLNPPGSKTPTPRGRPSATSLPLKQDVLINADYWEDQPRILGASLGFTNIIGVVGLGGTQRLPLLARRAGGTWERMTPEQASTAPLRAFTSAISPQTVATGYGYAVKNADGFPIEFSWPVRPSTLDASDFRVVLNTGQVVQPLVAAISPNLEYNERSTVVSFGYFGNRIAPGEPGAIYPVRFEVVPGPGALELVGPGGTIVSAGGLSFGDGVTPMTSYVPGSGPKLVAAKLSVMSTAGEWAPPLYQGGLPNDGVTLYGDAAQYRLRVLTTGGFSPDGVRSVYPTEFSRYFRLKTIDAQGVVRWLTETNVDYQLPSGTVRIVGLADLGPSQASYDPTYLEDHDNQIDIVLSGDASAVATITDIEIPATGGYSPFYNPGGPGNAPTPSVSYSQPGPSLLQPVSNALANPMTVTFVQPAPPRSLARPRR